jgi:hypothetical protein
MMTIRTHSCKQLQSPHAADVLSPYQEQDSQTKIKLIIAEDKDV